MPFVNVRIRCDICCPWLVIYGCFNSDSKPVSEKSIVVCGSNQRISILYPMQLANTEAPVSLFNVHGLFDTFTIPLRFTMWSIIFLYADHLPLFVSLFCFFAFLHKIFTRKAAWVQGYITCTRHNMHSVSTQNDFTDMTLEHYSCFIWWEQVELQG